MMGSVRFTIRYPRWRLLTIILIHLFSPAILLVHLTIIVLTVISRLFLLLWWWIMLYLFIFLLILLLLLHMLLTHHFWWVHATHCVTRKPSFLRNLIGRRILIVIGWLLRMIVFLWSTWWPLVIIKSFSCLLLVRGNTVCVLLTWYLLKLLVLTRLWLILWRIPCWLWSIRANVVRVIFFRLLREWSLFSSYSWVNIINYT